ncbi:CheY-like chemotaxis protein [Chryseobacterium defluvii]|uniref:CheY-like chemotaxis protein n=1 Tax=Chryseobacterium defluvii TaxID=160396 RepID=A0A840KFB5_9FLAO|nr:response regulator [Chryseobacterium defluvii]MBB4807886.1 CheY-like chemotaxis protein [Chryseobacterium defluvii]
MNKEYLNVIVTDYDEGNLIFFKNICKDLKIGVKIQTFHNGEHLMEYLNSEEALIPDILFMNYHIPGRDSLKCLEDIKADFRLNSMVNVIYSEHLSEDEVEEVFVKGANICMKKPDEYAALKRILTEIITVNWQYYTSGLNKDNFIMKV